MFTYTYTAGDVIDSVIQDGQVQTTNRTALLDYVNRVSNRMLRESKWLFLRSPEYRFITQPDVEKYWLGSGTPPAGCVNTGLNLSDIYGILGDSVFDLTNMRILTQDSARTLVGYGMRYKDGNFRSEIPRAYRYDPNTYGVFHLLPPPDGNNNYQPIPSSPVCNYTAGGTLAVRQYFVLVTLVDSIGGESLPCSQPSDIIVPADNLLTVQSPTLEVASATTVTYPFYNVYIAEKSTGPYLKVTGSPVSQGSTWTEPTTGAADITAPETIYINDGSGNLYTLGVTSEGLLTTTNQGRMQPAPLWYVADSSGNTYLLLVNGAGNITSIVETVVNPSTIILYDGVSSNWQIGVDSEGRLTTTNVGSNMGYIQPPQFSTIEPLKGYVIAFKYQRDKIKISTPTQNLQIPDEYFDVVVAGVNYFANLYTAKPDDLMSKAAFWKKEFMDGLAQMRRDLRTNFRNTDFVAPDDATQYSPTTQFGYSFYFV